MDLRSNSACRLPPTAYCLLPTLRMKKGQELPRLGGESRWRGLLPHESHIVEGCPCDIDAGIRPGASVVHLCVEAAATTAGAGRVGVFEDEAPSHDLILEVDLRPVEVEI